MTRLIRQRRSLAEPTAVSHVSAQLAQQQANLDQLLNGNRTEDIAQAQAQLSFTQLG